MRVPSNAQAALLAVLAEHEAAGRQVEWQVPNASFDRPAAARLWTDIEPLVPADGWTNMHRVVTVEACLRAGWLDGAQERTIDWPATAYRLRPETWHLRQLDLTEDGVIALGLWRARRLNAAPAPLPRLTEREREIVELAQRAHELGYALCARKPARLEARRMRRAGWLGECWVANHAAGLVPTPMAICEVRPEMADTAAQEVRS